jgi:hypothetical protein
VPQEAPTLGIDCMHDCMAPKQDCHFAGSTQHMWIAGHQVHDKQHQTAQLSCGVTLTLMFVWYTQGIGAEAVRTHPCS